MFERDCLDVFVKLASSRERSKIPRPHEVDRDSRVHSPFVPDVQAFVIHIHSLDIGLEVVADLVPEDQEKKSRFEFIGASRGGSRRARTPHGGGVLSREGTLEEKHWAKEAHPYLLRQQPY